MKGLALLALAVLLTACGTDTQAPEAKPNGYVPQVNAALATLNVACPGLERYWPDVITAGVTGNESNGFEVEVIVDMSPTKLPVEFHAQGQHCRYQVGVQSPQSVTTIKNACVSICRGEFYDGPRDIVVIR